MGRMLGVFDNDEELDRPDLNKCPDCGCFFAQDACPLCKKVCPTEMRAGNRAAVKKKKRRRPSGSGRVTFVDWYHSWWFIVLMMFFMPIIGIVLLITSPHERWKKLLFVAVAAVYLLISSIGIGAIVSGTLSLWDKPVDTSLSEEEYVAACREVTPEQFYRSPEDYKDAYLCMTLRVVACVEPESGYQSDAYYLCCAPDADTPTVPVIVRDCLLSGQKKLIPGDIITVWGEGDGECTVYDNEYNMYRSSCLNMAYVGIE